MKRNFILLLLLCPFFSVAQQPQTLTGTVVNMNGEPVVNAGVTAKHSKTSTGTNAEGVFSIIINKFPDTLWITHVGYKTFQYPLNGPGRIIITLTEAANTLDETVVIAYGKTTRRMNTGSVARITAKTISSQPVNDVLQALAGRMAGVTVTQVSGHAGAGTKIQVRGRNSIAQGTEPLYIIDGVPFAPGNESTSKLSSQLGSGAGTGLSPFYSIDPQGIESIEVLKDADATAIYGSRGANGVVLITTKKGKGGGEIQANLVHSFSSITRTMAMLGTSDYLQLRKEAFANDGVAMTTANAPDVLLFDSTAYTNFRKLFTGGTAKATEAQLRMSGGNGGTGFFAGGSYRNEGSVLPGGFESMRIAANLGFNHAAESGLSINATANYSYSRNNITSGDLGYYINLAPNFPAFFDSTGNLNWQHKGYTFNNPLAYTLTKYSAHSNNLLANATVSLPVAKGLRMRASLGYNLLTTAETSVTPIAAQNPANGPTGTLNLAQSGVESWIAEPQLEYNRMVLGGRLTVLAGGSFQNNTNKSLQLQGTGYASDDLLLSIGAAPNIATKRNQLIHYRYTALFGRLNYNYANRYLVNITGRRDGSSRFGPANRFNNFAAVGAGWIFSNEAFGKKIAVLSYGKLRASYGTSGNDQVGDYSYLDNWGSATAYNGGAALYPLNLYNPALQWEVNRKLEIAMELGFFKDRILFTAAWFRNRSGNQLISYRLPTQTGYSFVLKNMPAVVENSGVEIELNTENIASKHFEWRSSFNLTIPKNKLLRFPGLATSSYASSYVVGEPLSVIYKLRYNGVDAATGVFAFEDADKNGTVALVSDYQVLGNTEPQCYGGMNHEIRYKNIGFSVFVEFKQQTGRNVYASIYQAPAIPGMMYNMPAIVNNRWRQAGDVSRIQRATASTASAAYKAAGNFLLSDGIYSDASYLRVKNMELVYHLPAAWMKRMKIEQCRLYLQAQNILTITGYEGTDPETQGFYGLPPLKTVAMGVRVSL